MDDEAFAAFVRAHATALTRLAYAVCGDVGRAQDASQTALEKVYLRRGSVQDPLAYARRTAVNAARDTWRRYGRREALRPPEDRAGADDGRVEGGRVEDQDLLERALHCLTRQQRQVVLLRHWLDLSERETAGLLHVTAGTVKSQNSRALTKLREQLLAAGP